MPVTNLRHEPCVRPKVVAEIPVEREPVETFRVVAPLELRAVRGEGLTCPGRRQVGAIRCLCAAPEPLALDVVAARRPPLKIRSDDAVVAAAVMSLTIGRKKADVGQ